MGPRLALSSHNNSFDEVSPGRAIPTTMANRHEKKSGMNYWTVGDLTDCEARAASRASITARVFSSRGFT